MGGKSKPKAAPNASASTDTLMLSMLPSLLKAYNPTNTQQYGGPTGYGGSGGWVRDANGQWVRPVPMQMPGGVLPGAPALGAYGKASTADYRPVMFPTETTPAAPVTPADLPSMQVPSMQVAQQERPYLQLGGRNRPAGGRGGGGFQRERYINRMR